MASTVALSCWLLQHCSVCTSAGIDAVRLALACTCAHSLGPMQAAESVSHDSKYSYTAHSEDSLLDAFICTCNTNHTCATKIRTWFLFYDYCHFRLHYKLIPSPALQVESIRIMTQLEYWGGNDVINLLMRSILFYFYSAPLNCPC